MTSTIIFDPLIPLPMLWGVAALALVAVALAVLRGLQGWALRGAAMLVVLAALSGPSVQQEDRAPLTDIGVMLEDESASESLADRPAHTAAAAETLAAQITARANTELRRVTVPDGEGDSGTQLMTALSEVLAEEPRARIAGILALSDGRIHDADLPVDLPAPMHLLMT